jgi:thiamine biosynthesis lipoprotein
MDRRDFLHPGQLASAAGNLLGAAAALDADVAYEPPEHVALLRAARRAMATTFEIFLPFGTPRAQMLAESAFDEIDRLEQQLTVYRDTSEVSRLNRLAPQVAVPVEEKLFDLLALAARITEETAGAYDIAAGALVKAWGFYKGPRRVPTMEELAAALSRAGMRHVVLDHQARTVRFLRKGLEINLGSIGKGYALDRVAALLRANWNLDSALLHGGHSSVYAIGSEPGGDAGWSVGIRHPGKTDCRLGVVRLRDRALGTSAATFQHLEYNGRKLGHILDPRSGWPAEGLAAATVLAPSAALADALSTAFFIMGVDGARAYCASHPDVGAVLVPQEESAAPVVIGLSPEDVTVYDA